MIPYIDAATIEGAWPLVVAVPLVFAGRGDSLPTAMSIFFAVWVAVLPFVIPWRYLFAA